MIYVQRILFLSFFYDVQILKISNEVLSSSFLSFLCHSDSLLMSFLLPRGNPQMRCGYMLRSMLLAEERPIKQLESDNRKGLIIAIDLRERRRCQGRSLE